MRDPIDSDVWANIFSFLEPRDAHGAAAVSRRAASGFHQNAANVVRRALSSYGDSLNQWFVFDSLQTRVVFIHPIVVDAALHPKSYAARLAVDPRVDAPSRLRVLETSRSDPFDPFCWEIWCRVSRYPDPIPFLVSPPEPDGSGVLVVRPHLELWSRRPGFDAGTVSVMGRHPQAPCALALHGVWRDGSMWRTRDWDDAQMSVLDPRKRARVD